jgi:SecA DEAD-like domain/SecA preprotein cross-linking domain
MLIAGIGNQFVHSAAPIGMLTGGNQDSKISHDPCEKVQKISQISMEQVSFFSSQFRIQLIIKSFEFCQGKEEALSYWYQTIKETLGETTFILVSNPLSFTSSDTQGILCLLQWIVEIGDDADLHTELVDFYHQRISLAELLEKIEKIKNEIEISKYPPKNLQDVLNAFASPKLGTVSIPLSQIDLEKISNQYAQIEVFCNDLRKCDIGELVNQVRTIRSKKEFEETDKIKLIAIAREAIRLKFQIDPYNTQILATLGLLNHPSEFKGRVAEVKTGEGKSTIAALLAFYHACLGKNVAVISPSRYLAIRDQTKYQEFYRFFGISSSHICADILTEAHCSGQIIFGTNSDFEFFVMGESIREKRLGEAGRFFHVAIVDEVDNLFIDVALNASRMSIPSQDKYRWVYQPILNFVKEQGDLILNKSNVIAELRQMLIAYQEGKFKEVINLIEDEKFSIWISSAKAALYKYNVDEEYVLKPIQKSSQNGFEKGIILVDKENTGRLMHGMRASRGVHEFLEAKHQLNIHEEGAMIASLSHPIFFERFQNIYGITGTLGSQIERQEIETVYQVDTFDVPPHRENLQQQFPSLICATDELHYQTILNDIQSMIEKGRPVLVLFESIKLSEDFVYYLNEQGIDSQLLNERQLEHEDFIIAKAGKPKMVTVATNTAGRGTDIIPHPDSLKLGGLHVIFTFYPPNDRVEKQGLGRSARQGQPGSSRLILLSKEGDSLQDLFAKREKTIRELSEMRKQRIDIERINYPYLNGFLLSLRTWNDVLEINFMKQIAKNLQQKSGEFDLVQFVQGAKSALRDHILLSWSENFYGKLDDIYLKMTQNSLENLIVTYSQNIKSLYESVSPQWENYLKNPEKGFREYLNNTSK